MASLIILQSFKDLKQFIPKKINDVEKRFHSALGDRSDFERILGEDKELHDYRNPVRALQTPSLGLYFKVKDDVGQCELVLGTNEIGSRTVFSDLNDREKMQYNVAVVLQPRRRTMITSTGYEMREFVSSFGRLYGEGDDVGCKWLNFQSREQQSKVQQESQLLSSLEPQLITANVNHGPSGTTDYWGFRFRASDLGNGELAALVQHLLLP